MVRGPLRRRRGPEPHRSEPGGRRPGAARLASVALCTVLVACALGCSTWRGAKLYQSGTAALDRGEPDRAVEDLERAAELVPHASEIQNHLGIAYLEAGREDEALDAFRRAVELDCDNDAARRNLASLEARASTP